MNSRPPRTPRLLWFDLTHDRSAADCIAVFADTCRIAQAKDLSLSGLGAEQRPDMICMHYDRPDTLGLGLLMEVKRTTPSIPITMPAAIRRSVSRLSSRLGSGSPEG